MKPERRQIPSIEEISNGSGEVKDDRDDVIAHVILLQGFDNGMHAGVTIILNQI